MGTRWNVDQPDSTMMNMNKEFEFHDFMDDPNFDQFINLIRGDNEDPILSPLDPIPDLINSCFLDNYQFPPCPSTTLTSANISNAKHRPKADRSKTLISERRRRGRMKQSLYALRSLVPNITKMDKASIVGDAVSYVQDLQAQAKKLNAEVEALEASLLASSQNHNQGSLEIFCNSIMQMEVIQVEESEYYVKVVCDKGEGVASSLYRAFESLSAFTLHNSNLASLSHTFQLTLTLKVKGCEAEINLPNLKLWLTGALLNQGFQFTT